jgi:hypothetical protein
MSQIYIWPCHMRMLLIGLIFGIPTIFWKERKTSLYIAAIDVFGSNMMSAAAVVCFLNMILLRGNLSYSRNRAGILAQPQIPECHIIISALGEQIVVSSHSSWDKLHILLPCCIVATLVLGKHYIKALFNCSKYIYL